MFFKNDGAEGPGRAQIPALPLRDIVVFPHMVSQLFVGREKSIAALDEAMARDKEIFLVAQKNARTNDPGPDEIYEVGTVGTIVQLLRLADGTVKVLVERLYQLMQGEIEILQVEKKIRSRVKKQMERSQKEYYLNEQMQAIQ